MLTLASATTVGEPLALHIRINHNILVIAAHLCYYDETTMFFNHHETWAKEPYRLSHGSYYMQPQLGITYWSYYHCTSAKYYHYLCSQGQLILPWDLPLPRSPRRAPSIPECSNSHLIRAGSSFTFQWVPPHLVNGKSLPVTMMVTHFHLIITLKLNKPVHQITNLKALQGWDEVYHKYYRLTGLIEVNNRRWPWRTILSPVHRLASAGTPNCWEGLVLSIISLRCGPHCWIPHSTHNCLRWVFRHGFVSLPQESANTMSFHQKLK